MRVGFLRRARIWYRRHGVCIQRVMTDNGACYLSTLHALACRRRRLRRLRTRPRRPRTNGKAERFIPHPAGRLGIPRHLRQLT